MVVLGMVVVCWAVLGVMVLPFAIGEHVGDYTPRMYVMGRMWDAVAVALAGRVLGWW